MRHFFCVLLALFVGTPIAAAAQGTQLLERVHGWEIRLYTNPMNDQTSCMVVHGPRGAGPGTFAFLQGIPGLLDPTERVWYAALVIPKTLAKWEYTVRYDSLPAEPKRPALDREYDADQVIWESPRQRDKILAASRVRVLVTRRESASHVAFYDIDLSDMPLVWPRVNELCPKKTP